MLATGKGVFELSGYREEDLLGRDVKEIVEADPNPVAVALEWGVRRLGQQVGLKTRAGLQQARRRRPLPRARRGRRPAGRAQTRELGHRSVRTHCSQSGRRAMHTRRPCQISRCGKHAPVLARHELHQVALDLDRDPPAASVRAAATSRRTCVSTTTPCGSPSSAATTFAVLRATPGSTHELVDGPRHDAVELLEQRLHRSADRLRLLPEETRRVDVALELLHRNGEVVLRAPVLLEQRRGHAVDVHVRRLRREHHRDEQLELAAEASARSSRRGASRCEPLDDRAGCAASSARRACAPRERSSAACGDATARVGKPTTRPRADPPCRPAARLLLASRAAQQCRRRTHLRKSENQQGGGDAYALDVDNAQVPANTPTKVAERTLPPGKYLLSAKLWLTADGPSIPPTVAYCSLGASGNNGGSSDYTYGTISSNANGSWALISPMALENNTGWTLGAGGTIASHPDASRPIQPRRGDTATSDHGAQGPPPARATTSYGSARSTRPAARRRSGRGPSPPSPGVRRSEAVSTTSALGEVCRGRRRPAADAGARTAQAGCHELLATRSCQPRQLHRTATTLVHTWMTGASRRAPAHPRLERGDENALRCRA